MRLIIHPHPSHEDEDAMQQGYNVPAAAALQKSGMSLVARIFIEGVFGVNEFRWG